MIIYFFLIAPNVSYSSIFDSISYMTRNVGVTLVARRIKVHWSSLQLKVMSWDCMIWYYGCITCYEVDDKYRDRIANAYYTDLKGFFLQPIKRSLKAVLSIASRMSFDRDVSQTKRDAEWRHCTKLFYIMHDKSFSSSRWMKVAFFVRVWPSLSSWNGFWPGLEGSVSPLGSHYIRVLPKATQDEFPCPIPFYPLSSSPSALTATWL